MRQTTPLDPSSQHLKSLRLFTVAIYSLYILAFIIPLAIIPGVIIAYVKRRSAKETLYASHFNSQIIVFWISLAVTVALAAVSTNFVEVRIASTALLICLFFWAILGLILAVLQKEYRLSALKFWRQQQPAFSGQQSAPPSPVSKLDDVD